MKTQLDRDRIAEEAIGQRHGSAPDYAPTKADMSQEEAALQLAPSSGAQASIPEKTAESVGERVGDAYSDSARVAQYPKGNVGRWVDLDPSSFAFCETSAQINPQQQRMTDCKCAGERHDR